MSEYLNFDSDGYPSFVIPNGAEKIEGNPANTTVYLHGAEYKGVDHIFVETDENELGQAMGPFIWRIISNNFMNGMFDDLVLELAETGFDIITADKPAESDFREWEAYVDKITVKVTNKKIKKRLLNGE